MGAAYIKPDEATATKQGKPVFAPNCIDCTTVCQLSKKPQTISQKQNSTQPRKSKKNPSIPTFIWHESDEGQSPSVVQEVVTASPTKEEHKRSWLKKLTKPKSAQDLEYMGVSDSRHQTEPKPIKHSLSFQGVIPADWSKAQHERLNWAVDEVARRHKIRPPGPRIMQEILSIKAVGKQDSTAYNSRQALIL